MSRNVDLSGKLGLEPKPTVTIGDTVLTINDSAKNMLLVMETVGDEPTTSDIIKAAELLFTQKSHKALDALDLNLADYLEVVNVALELVTGSLSGEAVTLDTTS